MEEKSKTHENMSEQEAGRDNSYAAGTSGIIFSFVVVSILLVVVFVYKAYRTTFQRLILYFIIIALFCELTFALQLVLNLSNVRWICVPIIYFYLYFPLACHVYITLVTNTSFLLALRLLKGTFTKIQKGGQCGEVEVFCIVLTIITPMAYIWIPIHDGSYEALNCNGSEEESEMDTWNKDAIVLNLIVLVMCLEVVLVCIVLCCIFCLVRCRVRNRQTTILLKKLVYHTGINAVMMGINLLAVTYSFYRSRVHPSELMSDIVNTILGILLPLIIFVAVLFQALLSIRTAKGQSRSYTVHQIKCNGDTNCEDPTNPTSHPINQPSHTYFSAPYTGAFLTISAEHTNSEGERRPLIHTN